MIEFCRIWVQGSTTCNPRYLNWAEEEREKAQRHEERKVYPNNMFSAPLCECASAEAAAELVKRLNSTALYIRDARLLEALRDFTKDVGGRLAEKEAEGKAGWDNLGCYASIENGMFIDAWELLYTLELSTEEKIKKLLDIAARCMMLHYQLTHEAVNAIS